MSNQSIATATDHAGIRIPPPLFYAVIFIAALLFQQVLPLPEPPRSFSRVAGLIFGGLGAGLCIWSITLFWRARTSLIPIKPSMALVSAGPYRFTRNPMYLGLLSLYVGLGFWWPALWAIILLPLVVGIIQRQVIRKEEWYLERRFGAAYLDYKQQVRRWL